MNKVWWVCSTFEYLAQFKEWISFEMANVRCVHNTTCKSIECIVVQFNERTNDYTATNNAKKKSVYFYTLKWQPSRVQMNKVCAVCASILSGTRAFHVFLAIVWLTLNLIEFQYLWRVHYFESKSCGEYACRFAPSGCIQQHILFSRFSFADNRKINIDLPTYRREYEKCTFDTHRLTSICGAINSCALTFRNVLVFLTDELQAIIRCFTRTRSCDTYRSTLCGVRPLNWVKRARINKLIIRQ